MNRTHSRFVALLGLVAVLATMSACTFITRTTERDNFGRCDDQRYYDSTTIVNGRPVISRDYANMYGQPAPAMGTIPQTYTTMVSMPGASGQSGQSCNVDLVIRFLLPEGHLKRIMILGVDGNVSNQVIDTNLSPANRMFHVTIRCAPGTVLSAQGDIYDDLGTAIGWVELSNPPVINSRSDTVTWQILAMRPIVIAAPPGAPVVVPGPGCPPPVSHSPPCSSPPPHS